MSALQQYSNFGERTIPPFVGPENHYSFQVDDLNLTERSKKNALETIKSVKNFKNRCQRLSLDMQIFTLSIFKLFCNLVECNMNDLYNFLVHVDMSCQGIINATYQVQLNLYDQEATQEPTYDWERVSSLRSYDDDSEWVYESHLENYSPIAPARLQGRSFVIHEDSFNPVVNVNQTFDVPMREDISANRTFDVPMLQEISANRTYDVPISPGINANRTYDISTSQSVNDDPISREISANQSVAANVSDRIGRLNLSGSSANSIREGVLNLQRTETNLRRFVNYANLNDLSAFD